MTEIKIAVGTATTKNSPVNRLDTAGLPTTD